MDLLEHEVGVARPLGGLGVPVDVGELGLDRAPGGVLDLDGARSEDSELAVFEKDDVAGVVHDGHHVACHEARGTVRAHDDGAVLAAHDDLLGMVGVDGGDAVGTLQLGDGLAHGGSEVAFVVALEQVGDCFRVCLADELVPLGAQLVAQRGEVLDDAVVDHGDLAGAVLVGMGVGLARLAVRCPAGVADAAAGGQLQALDRLCEFLHLAHPADDLETAGAVRHGDAGRVVAAVLELPQAPYEYALGLVVTHVSDDSAHRNAPFRSLPYRLILVEARSAVRRRPPPQLPLDASAPAAASCPANEKTPLRGPFHCYVAKEALGLCGDDVHAALVTAGVLDGAVCQGEQGVVLAAAHVLAGVEVGAVLANEDHTGGDDLAGELLAAQTLCAGVATVASGA